MADILNGGVTPNDTIVEPGKPDDWADTILLSTGEEAIIDDASHNRWVASVNARAMAEPQPVRVTSATGGAKESKLARFDQIPTYPLHCLAEHYGAGNAKYPSVDGDNWRKGYNWSLSYAAMQRHANAFWAGEDIDAETGHSHLTAVAWHAFALLEWTRHPELSAKFDDRQNHPKGSS